MTDDAPGKLKEAAPSGWYVGTPTYDDRHGEWVIHAFDPDSVANNGLRAREWTAVGPTEEQAVRTMVACLHEIAAGRVPK